MKLKIAILGLFLISSGNVFAEDCPAGYMGDRCLKSQSNFWIIADSDNSHPGDEGFQVYVGNINQDQNQVKTLNMNNASTTIDTKSGSSLAINADGTTVTTAMGKVTQFGDTNVNFNGQTLTGITAGAISSTSTDAINGSQLYIEQEARIAADNTERDARIAADNTERDARIAADNAATADRAVIRQELAEGDARTLASAKHYTDQRLNKLDERMQAAVAASIAIATLPQPTEAGASMISVGLGNWESEQGYAVGISGVTENNKWIYKAAGTANSIGKFGAGISLGFQWK